MCLRRPVSGVALTSALRDDFRFAIRGEAWQGEVRLDLAVRQIGVPTGEFEMRGFRTSVAGHFRDGPLLGSPGDIILAIVFWHGVWPKILEIDASKAAPRFLYRR